MLNVDDCIKTEAKRLVRECVDPTTQELDREKLKESRKYLVRLRAELEGKK